MDIKIDLKDKARCEGCPCLVYSYASGKYYYYCNLKYDIKNLENYFRSDEVKRDPKCIKERGE